MASIKSDTALVAATDGSQFAYVLAALAVIFFAAEYFEYARSYMKDQSNRRYVTYWLMFFAIGILGYMFQPRAKDPSIAITFGAVAQLFATCLLWLVPRAGVSGESPEGILILISALVMRLAATTRHQGYLPTDITGDGPYQLIEVVTVLVAIRGIMRTGLTAQQGVTAGAALSVTAYMSMQCFGDLNRKAFIDRLFAASVYAEVVAMLYLARGVINEKRDFRSSFLLPMMLSGACRTYFWYLSQDEMKPMKPVLMMKYFPPALVTANIILAVVPLVTALLVYLPVPQEAKLVQPADIASVSTPTIDPAAVTGLPTLPAPPDSGCKSFVPASAEFENGVLRVQYEPVY